MQAEHVVPRAEGSHWNMPALRNTTDRLHHAPMGRFDKEEPQYPTPEPKRDSTTVITGSSTTTPLPAFRPYIGPEQITGSHMAREVYNIRHHGKPRFVKIDLLNE
ncbi:hypothetical protein COOONC_22581 [Cooperia oncophora]